MIDNERARKSYNEQVRMINEFYTNLTPQQRDRLIQSHLAQARGPRRNYELMRDMMNSFLHAQRRRLKDNETP
jgi:Spy/CpxP family protein refolding chaperone